MLSAARARSVARHIERLWRLSLSLSLYIWVWLLRAALYLSVQKALSVVEVTKPSTFNAGVPVHNGPNDPRFGAADRMSTCSTCKNTYAGGAKVNDCPGHFGHIEVRILRWMQRRRASRFAAHAAAPRKLLRRASCCAARAA